MRWVEKQKSKPEENMGEIIDIIMDSTWRKPAREVKQRGSPFLCLWRDCVVMQDYPGLN